MCRKTYIYVFVAGLLFLLFTACRKEKYIYEPREDKVTEGETIQDTVPGTDPANPEIIILKGFYLLNEGNMGSNKATLDYFDFATGIYTHNIYGAANPDVVQELGDVGNDLQIYGNRLYAVINCSNLLEVMDARTAKHIGSVTVPNCRYICFAGRYAYLTSYAGPVSIDPDYEQIGYVAKIDTATLQVVATCNVGFQPEELAIVGNKLYVANSGGYMVPNYENTVSVINLETFTEEKRITVEINLHRLRTDKNNNIWVSSRGDYYDIPSNLFCIDPTTDEVTRIMDVPVSDCCIQGDSLYFYSKTFSYITYDWETTYGIINVNTGALVTSSFITDGTELETPYGIKVNPINKDIYLADAGNYVSPGTLYCFGADGVKKWQVTTGDIPAHMAFLTERVKN